MFYFDQHFTEICSHGSNQQYDSIDSDHGLALMWGQDIIQSNYDLIYWRIYESLDFIESNTAPSNFYISFIRRQPICACSALFQP